MSEGEMWSLPNGVVLANVHPPTACEGRGCAIHHPSNHRMRLWPMLWRGDRHLIERACPHGIGHPDPDDLAYRRQMFHSEEDADADGVHGCCGCCIGSTDAVESNDD